MHVRDLVALTLPPDALARFDEASRHPYGCACDLCREWWMLVPPEPDDEPAGRQCPDCGAIDGFSHHFPECPNAEPP